MHIRAPSPVNVVTVSKVMNKKTLEKRMRELEIYSDFCLRKEIKVLAGVLQENEILNCILTGVHDGNRKMLAVTDQRVAVIFSAALGGGEVKVIRGEAVKDYEFVKKLLFSSARIATAEENMVFTNTQGSLGPLFLWAMERLTGKSNHNNG